MTVQEALNVLVQIVEQYFTGLPKDQRVVQQALQVMNEAAILVDEAEKKEAKKEEKKTAKKKESNGNK